MQRRTFTIGPGLEAGLGGRVASLLSALAALRAFGKPERVSDFPTAAELVSAFVHPPRLFAISRRTTSADVVEVISHVEAWPWRVVLRGVRARPAAPASGSDQRLDAIGSGASVGVVTAVVVKGEGSWADDVRQLVSWEVSDDVGTDYRSSSASGGGVGSLWEDFSIEFEPAVPANATLLRIVTADGSEIVVDLDT